MKLKIKTKIFPIAICLIAYLFAWTNAASANILCFGSDGHIAIEKTYQDSCSLNNLAVGDSASYLSDSKELNLVNASDTCDDTTAPFNSLNKKFSSDDNNNFFAFDTSQKSTFDFVFIEPKSKVSISSRELRNQNLDFLKTVILTI